MNYKGFHVVIAANDVGSEDEDEVIEYAYTIYDKNIIDMVYEDQSWYSSFRNCKEAAELMVDSF